MSRGHAIVQAISGTPVAERLRHGLPRQRERLTVGGLVGAAGSGLLATLYQEHSRRILVAVAPNPDGATQLQADLQALLGAEVSRLYPQYESRIDARDGADPRIDALRVEAVEALLAGHGRLFVTTPRALQERMVIPDRLAQLHLELSVGEEIGLSLLSEELEVMGYRRAALVEEVGQFAVRGGLVDVFSLGLQDPIRIEFWGDEIQSIRSFEVTDQRSHEELPAVRLLPTAFRSGDGSGLRGGRALRAFLEVLPTETLAISVGGVRSEEEFQRSWRHARNMGAPPETLLRPSEAAAALRELPALRLTEEPGHALSLASTLPPAMERKMSRLTAFLREEAAQGARTLILCDNQGQVERLEEILVESGDPVPGVTIGLGAVEAGFRIPSSPRLNVLTDHEIFRRRRRVRSGRRFGGAMALESLAQLSDRDYVVHMDHGIGQFRGLERIEVAGDDLEVLVIRYADGEILRVPVYRLDLVERWIGDTEDSEPPAVHRIGGRQWKTLRRRTEAAIEKMTQELLELYAEREIVEGFKFSPDSKWQTEMEAGFLYEDTPDQTRVTREVKRDMESPRPMDRLICGDVGFGKTEIAIRAAFKAIEDGKQVAVLAPTTILVEQHRRSFEERLADFPVRVASISRFQNQREQTESLLALERGEVDIVVGTHRLLSRDVRFRELGLLVIDEEQRFGVKHKEALKKIRVGVDVLALTATPIPRTLQLSLAGVRTLSLIQSPPKDRLAVSTQAIPWSEALLSEILTQELDRGGQSFVLHNRIDSILTVAERLQRLVPEARVEIAHGQMSPGTLDETMTGFIDGEVDVLVCSSIIENGLDVPNANTLIVDRADRFGLSQLYQIRGRVGRSNRRAYCYLVVPESLSEDARRRVHLLERHTELGSGYQVALRDLEMRGAGNLLGANQSGFAHAVGMDTYLRLLDDAVRRVRTGLSGDREFPEPEVSLSGSAFIPDEYVSDSGQKLHLYRRLSRLEDRSDVDRLREEVRDRFGPVPDEVERLLDARLLRLLGKPLGVERIFVNGGEGRITFRAAASPRLATLETPLRDRQVEVKVRRMVPLSLSLRQAGPEPLTRTLARALNAIPVEPAQAA